MPTYRSSTEIDSSQLAQVVKFKLCSDKWTPSKPAQLGFDAMVRKCSDPDHVKIARILASDLLVRNWLISACDELVFLPADALIVLEGYAKLPAVEFPEILEIGKREGVEFTELPADGE